MSDSTWKPVRLGDIAQIKHGFAFKGEYFSDTPPGDILLTPGNFCIGGGFNPHKHKYYNGPLEETYALQGGEVVVTMTDLSKDGDTLGYSAIVPNDNRRYLHNQRIGLVNIIDGAPAIDKFIYWVLRTAPYRHNVLASATGSTVRHTSPGRILSYEFSLPSVAEQHAIASVLGTLDDKIDLNRWMNETLEAMARAIFKDWFVDFGPVRAKAEGRPPYLSPELWSLFPDALDDEDKPVGWKDERLSDIADVIMGASPSGDTYNDEAVGVPLVNGPVEFGEYFPIQSKWTTSPTRLSENGDLLLCVRGSTTGRYIFADGMYCLGRGVCAIRSKTGHQTFVDRAVVDRIDTLLEKTTGSVFPNLSSNDIKDFETPPASRPVIQNFVSLTEPLRSKVWESVWQNETLAQLRDLLLPKLMSGEIRLRDAEKAVEAAL